MSAFAAVIILAASSVPAAGRAIHADEITAFASTMAIAKTVKEICAGMAQDDHFLELLRQRLHVANVAGLRSCRKLERSSGRKSAKRTKLAL